MACCNNNRNNFCEKKKHKKRPTYFWEDLKYPCGFIPEVLIIQPSPIISSTTNFGDSNNVLLSSSPNVVNTNLVNNGSLINASISANYLSSPLRGILMEGGHTLPNVVNVLKNAVNTPKKAFLMEFYKTSNDYINKRGTRNTNSTDIILLKNVLQSMSLDGSLRSDFEQNANIFIQYVNNLKQ